MLKRKKKNEQLHHYKKTIYFVNGNMRGEVDVNLPLEKLEEHYIKALKDNIFIETDEKQNKTMVFNSKNIICVEIQEILDKGVDKE